MLLPCRLVVRWRGRVVRAWPPGCSPAAGAELAVEEETERLSYRERDGFCVVEEPRRAVLPGEACELLRMLEELKPFRALLLGPPGTGKSMLMEIVAAVSPLYTIEAEPEHLMSKYVGESERRLERLLDEAEENQPSLLLIDEGDMLVEERSLAGGENAYEATRSGMVRIFLRRLQRWSNIGAAVTVMLSSNKSVKALDTAMLRAGRFSHTIYFPPPTKRAIRLLAELHGAELSEDEIDMLARSAFSFSNVVHYLEHRELREYNPYQFARIVYADERVELRGIKATENARLVVAEPMPLAARLAAAVAAALWDKPIVLLTRSDRIVDVFYLARSAELPVAIPYTMSTAEMAPLLAEDYPHPVLYLGPDWRVAAPRITMELAERIATSTEKLYTAMGCPEAGDREELERCIAGIKPR